MKTPVILNFDDSVTHIENSLTIDLTNWQDDIRFGCSMSKFKQLKWYLNDHLPERYGTVLLGSGDYHHISLLLIERLAMCFSAKKPIQVVIFDNHPDNMRYVFGIHCGSWVSYVSRLPFVSQVHVVGITSHDISLGRLWENRLLPLINGKVTYWNIGVPVFWARPMGLASAFRHFQSPEELITTFLSEQYGCTQPIYLSIDKDVLSPDVVQTNWDQGQLDIHHLLDAITVLDKRIIGSDITGEISVWHAKNWLKRILTSMDKQPEILSETLLDLQREHQKINTMLLKQLHNDKIKNDVFESKESK